MTLMTFSSSWVQWSRSQTTFFWKCTFPADHVNWWFSKETFYHRSAVFAGSWSCQPWMSTQKTTYSWCKCYKMMTYEHDWWQRLCHVCYWWTCVMISSDWQPAATLSETCCFIGNVACSGYAADEVTRCIVVTSVMWLAVATQLMKSLTVFDRKMSSLVVPLLFFAGNVCVWVAQLFCCFMLLCH